MPPKPKFQEGEKVCCFHGPLLYEAKTVKAEVKNNSVRYLIHYSGWNKNWDEWVPESRVLKFTEDVAQKQKELSKAHAGIHRKQLKASLQAPETSKTKGKAGKQGKGRPPKSSQDKEKDKDKDKSKEEKEKDRAATPTAEKRRSTATAAAAAAAASAATPSAPSSSTSESTGEPKKKRARGDPTVESEEHFLTKIEVKIKVPDELKAWLCDDWDLINRQKQLVDLPCKVTVDGIFTDYVKFKLSKGNAQKDALMEVAQGIKEYFNVMLGTQLLYKFERPQYAEILANHPDKAMSEIYGAMHLLRLFVRLGGMLAYTPLDEKSIQLLLSHIHDFLKYMVRNMNKLFTVSDYAVAPPEYHRKAI